MSRSPAITVLTNRDLLGAITSFQNGRPPAQWTGDAAAANGHLSLLPHVTGFTERAMDLAARYGHLDVVQWLHEHRSEGCSKYAMNWAAAFGHLDVVQFLHEHRSEGCTTDAMDLAAANDHLDVVRWLHENRSEGCSVKALDMARTRCHHDVAQWLQNNVALPE